MLLWFTQSRNLPPLIVGNPNDISVIPRLDQPGVQTLFGDGEGDDEMSVGVRLDYGKYLSDNIGIGGRFWTLADNSVSASYNASNYNGSLGIYNFDYNPTVAPNPGNDSVVLSANNGGLNVLGNARVEDSVELWAAEAYARLKFSCNKNCRLDFIGGFSHINLENDFGLNANVVDVTGLVRSYSDSLSTENEFNGGQVGFEMVMNRGRWMARSLTKVHLGNMEQTATASGSRSQVAAGGGAATTLDGGIFTVDTLGTATDDTFAFIPEVNFKLAYRFRKNVLLSAGYSFLYFDSVVMASDILDRNIDGQAVNSFTTPNFLTTPVIQDSSFWVQGVDLGIVIDF